MNLSSLDLLLSAWPTVHEEKSSTVISTALNSQLDVRVPWIHPRNHDA
jgi:hypothetical protein